MSTSTIHLHQTTLETEDKPISGQYIELDGEPFYRIVNYDQMRPFFMSIVSDSDHWMFISSNGALTAGRRNPESALFPYYTDDKIHDSSEITGSKTIVRVEKGGKTYLWEPFSERYAYVYALQRKLYKNVEGNKLIFEEINESLGLAFRYGWYNSEQFGFVRKARLENTGKDPVVVDIVDGIQNILPYGVNSGMQNERSTLVDAYKKNELLPDTGLGLFLLSAIIVDRAEPSEALMATTVWGHGLPGAQRLLCSLQLDNFRKGRAITQEEDVRAERGAYFMNSRFELAPKALKHWYLVAELNQGPEGVAALRELLSSGTDIESQLETDIALGTENLARTVGSADGLQRTAELPAAYRHFSNVLFNVMRGGIFVDNGQVAKSDFVKHLKNANRRVFEQQHNALHALPERLPYAALLAWAAESGNPQLERLCYEYLPLTFSRRHGDPSRPWNRFSIDIKEEDGSQKLYYQGNWRDVFQNWEALALSFPAFIESMIAKFVNASTPDGYNPYRITRDGIDWEVIEPDDPWSYIGYWGDHQVIYLLKLLELSHKYHPGKLEQLLTKNLFAYANVPYRIKEYEDLLKNPYDTVLFDEELETEIEARVKQAGADGKLICGADGEPYLANLTEKLLVMVLAKMSNFIPEGGIWLNTQRPEWNDANNALVGNGVSMVTLCYLRRFLAFAIGLYREAGIAQVSLLEEVETLLASIGSTLEKHRALLKGPISNRDRKSVLDGLGQAGSRYRAQAYQSGLSGKKKQVSTDQLLGFFEISLQYVDHSIRANKRSDGLYHAYNLMTVENDKAVSISYLYEMLEGQVAVLSAGCLSPKEASEVLEALRHSSIYREDQHTYLLYPDRQLPRFEDKNNIPSSDVERSQLLRRLVADGDQRLVMQDTLGAYHFNGDFNNANNVRAALEQLKLVGYAELVEKEGELILDLFEQIFNHKAFTGRSGTFFGYEGLGCIYWHMVSKLLLAAQENCYWAIRQQADTAIIQQLIAQYYDIRAGIGFNKSPESYGAFPSDPYSHTPGNAGAQQPGMTGQVKEDVLARFGELGLVVEDGKIRFQPRLLRESEFLGTPDKLQYFDLQGRASSLELPKGSLGFTYCQVPVVYHLSEKARIRLIMADGSANAIDGVEIGTANSARIFGRTGEVARIEVGVAKSLFGGQDV
ncbi:MAG: hypothetical protein H6564_18730 [Lewinellaceae bacterium]|nr:hypothetical protein [Lewinellaceae bacterium]